MEGSEAMGQDRGDMEADFHMKPNRTFWGFRREWKRHDVILCVVGLLYSLVGVYYIMAGMSRSRFESLAILLQVAPMTFWGSVFVFAGTLAIISSRWPPFAETWGYVVLTAISAGWGAAYLMGYAVAGAPSSNLIGALVWGLFGFAWWAVSGLLNPDKTAVADSEARPS